MKTLANCISVILLLTLNVGYAYAQQEHECVDLGLPSGTLWATCNVGAENPWDYGDYFAWGETEPKDARYKYYWHYYKYAEDTIRLYITKYCTNEERGHNGFTDGKTILEPDDDAATVNWGSEWCMPTKEQWKELTDSCIWTMVTLNGINGYEAKGPNGNTIFLPASGEKDGVSSERFFQLTLTPNGNIVRTIINDYIGRTGSYWSATLDDLSTGANVFGFNIYKVEPWVAAEPRCMGLSVRPVRCKQ